MTEPDQKGYKDWLEEAALDLKENGVSRSFTEIMSPTSEEAHSMAEETVIELTEEQKKTRSKAAKIVDKLKTTEGAELKKVLFSLKTFFQASLHFTAWQKWNLDECCCLGGQEPGE